MTKMLIRGVSLHVKVMGKGYPIVFMHGGPGADLYTLLSLKPLAKHFTLVFYDHRCNGRSEGADLASFTMDNLTADADALRSAFGFEKWAILGHSFGGYVAMEYALRYPLNVSHLVLMNTGAENSWAQVQAEELLARRGFSPEIVEITHRYFNGLIEPDEMFPSLMKLGKAYNPDFHISQLPRFLIEGAKTKLTPETFIYAESHFLKGYTIKDRLGDIKVPALLIAGREDFIYPPEAQQELLSGIPDARLVQIDRSGHNPHEDQPAEVQQLIREFLEGTKSDPS
jgi:proline iminopeptidase